jgi:hypothetical protein
MLALLMNAWCLLVCCVFLLYTMVFRLYLVRSVWTPERRSAYSHVGVRLGLQWRWEAHHQDHNSAGFLADI